MGINSRRWAEPASATAMLLRPCCAGSCPWGSASASSPTRPRHGPIATAACCDTSSSASRCRPANGPSWRREGLRLQQQGLQSGRLLPGRTVLGAAGTSRALEVLL